MLCTDIGGTSFDIALLTGKRFEVTTTPDMAKFLLNMPLVQIDSVGAGCGSYVRIDPNARRPEIGPDSAGAMIGTAWPEGGRRDGLDHRPQPRARAAEPRLLPRRPGAARHRARPPRGRRQVADPLGLGVEEAAAGVIELFETSLRNEAVGRILGKGYSPADYTLLCYGGGGPLHVAGYTAGVPYQQVLVPEWAAGFSAFGCACADFEYRFDQQVDLPLLPTDSEEAQVGMGSLLTQAWRGLEERVRAEFEKSGYSAGDVSFTHMVRMQYYGQLVDIEFDAPTAAIETPEDVAALKRDLRAGLHAHVRPRGLLAGARLPDRQGDRPGSVPIEKPTLPQMDRVEGSPPVKASRDVWWSEGFVATDVYEMDDVRRGHVIEGPAVLEAESTTFPVPPDRRASLDEHGIFHLENKGA